MRIVPSAVAVSILLGQGLSAQEQPRKWVPVEGRAGAEIERVLSRLSVGPAERYGRITLFPVANRGRECRLTVATLHQAMRNKWVEVVEVARGRQIRFRSFRSPALVFVDRAVVLDGGGQDSGGGEGGGNPPSGGGGGNGNGRGDSRGDNGVGNGEDPAPPGEPPQNDGDGSGPGEPGNRGGRDDDRGIYASEIGALNCLRTFCCEKGRGEKDADKRFDRAEFVAPPTTRSAIARGDQAGIWSSIESFEKAIGVSSRTHSLDSLYRSSKVAGPSEAAVRMLVRAVFAKDPTGDRSATGCILALDGRFLAIDLYANPGHFRAAFPTLVKSYALEALGTPPERGTLPEQGDAVDLLREVLASKLTGGPAPVGCGTSYPVRTDRVEGRLWTVGGALLRADLLVERTTTDRRADTPTSGANR